MAKSTSYKTKEEAVKAQGKQKEVVVDAKSALTKYLKKNDLDREKDYSKDKKHGAKIKELTLAIKKANEVLVDINKAVDGFKGSKAEKTKTEGKGSKGTPQKYDYPEGLTSEEKKKWRVAARKGTTDPKELMKAAKSEKTEKAPKAKKSEKVEKAPKEEKKSGKAEKAKKAPKEEKKAKKAKKSND